MPLAIGRDDERGDLEVVEVARALALEERDTKFVTEPDGLRCPAWSTAFAVADADVASAEPAFETPSGRTGDGGVGVHILRAERVVRRWSRASIPASGVGRSQ